MVQNGIVSHACTFLSQDVELADENVLDGAVRLLTSLVLDEEARGVMYEAKVLYPILGYLSHDSPVIKALWYEGMKELCSFSEFRGQLEKLKGATEIIK